MDVRLKPAKSEASNVAIAVEGRAPSRRAMLTAALGAGIGILATNGLARAAQVSVEGAAALWSQDYWVSKQRDAQTIRLSVFRKRAGAPQPGSPSKPVLFLVHGSSVSSRPTFDLTVPGHGEYSLMDVMARLGFDVWTMDHEGYGRSDRTRGNSDIASGVEDLHAAAELVLKETGQTRAHYLGQSSGALRAAAFAVASPDRVGRLVLEAYTYTGAGSPTLGARGKQVEFYRTHNLRPRDRAMIASIFTRDRPGTSDPAVGQAMADAEMPNGDTIPTGTYLDMVANLPIVKPEQLGCPVLLIRGAYDGISTMEDLLAFFRTLPNGDRQFSVIAGAAHLPSMSLNRAQYWHVVEGFLRMPPVA